MENANMVSGYKGTKNKKCRICGMEGEFPYYEVKEMYYGTGEVFGYFECLNCHCMQIEEIPENLGSYYPDNYYSYEEHEISEFPPVDAVKGHTRVLDVGCGSGMWLIERAQEGYGRLWGCDPFIAEDINYRNRIMIRKCTIHDMTGEYDIISLNDSFEHMSDPLEVLISIKKLLDTKGMCLINIPVYPNIAQKILGTNWYQWDAPRHLFLHSRQSMEYLCKQAGLEIKQVEYNSNAGQFVISHCYEIGIPMKDVLRGVGADRFTEEDMEELERLTAEANAGGNGDHAMFLIGHSS